MCAKEETHFTKLADSFVTSMLCERRGRRAPDKQEMIWLVCLDWLVEIQFLVYMPHILYTVAMTNTHSYMLYTLSGDCNDRL